MTETSKGSFFVDEPFIPGAQLSLSESDARHANVLRLAAGERVALRDGHGGVADCVLVRLGPRQALVEIESVHAFAAPAAVHLIVPVADRDRMLWLAEKAAELNVATWRPVLWQRSRSVAPRGDGPTFRAKVRARMIAALLQSRSAWLPEIYPEATADRAAAAAPPGTRLVLDANGVAVSTIRIDAPVTVAVGPEGGFEPREMELLADAGFVAINLGGSILRFETAAVAGIAVARAMLPLDAPQTETNA